MIETIPAVKTIFEKLTDWRKKQGQIHDFEAILSLICLGLLCGKQGPTAIARWGKKLPYRLRCQLGFKGGRVPSASTLCRMIWHLDVVALEAAISQWVYQVNAQLAQAGISQRIAIDGKSLRGARKRGAQDVHLLSAVDHQLKTVLAQLAVDDKTNEISAIDPLLEMLVLSGCVVTVDALLTQRTIAQTILAGGGDYVMIVKDNQPTLKADIETLFVLPPLPDEVIGQAQSWDKGHGRIETRQIETTSLLQDYADWPGLVQAFKLTRTTQHLKSGKRTCQVVFGCTSLSAQQASPADLLQIVRGHWSIENQLHWVRDVTFAEDASPIRKGNGPQVLAAFRNIALSLIRAAGFASIPEAIDTFSAQPDQPLKLFGLAT